MRAELRVPRQRGRSSPCATSSRARSSRTTTPCQRRQRLRRVRVRLRRAVRAGARSPGTTGCCPSCSVALPRLVLARTWRCASRAWPPSAPSRPRLRRLTRRLQRRCAASPPCRRPAARASVGHARPGGRRRWRRLGHRLDRRPPRRSSSSSCSPISTSTAHAGRAVDRSRGPTGSSATRSTPADRLDIVELARDHRGPTSSSTRATRASTRRSSTPRSTPAATTSTWRCTCRSPHPTDPYHAGRRDARRRAVRGVAAVGGARSCSPWSAWASSPGLSDVFARYAADQLFSRDRRDRRARRRRPRHRRAAASPRRSRSGPRSRSASTRRSCGSATAGGSRPRRSASPRRSSSPRASARIECVNVEHEEVVLDAPMGRCRAGHVQVRPRRRVHRGAGDAAQARASTAPQPVRVRRRRRVAARRRRRRAAQPGRARGPDARPHVRRHAGSRGTGVDGAPREVYLYQVVDNE